jgi:hypothetical protein
MGFNKRYVNKESLLNQYKTGGMEAVKTYLLKPDALIFASDSAEAAATDDFEELEKVLKNWLNGK